MELQNKRHCLITGEKKNCHLGLNVAAVLFRNVHDFRTVKRVKRVIIFLFEGQ